MKLLITLFICLSAFISVLIPSTVCAQNQHSGSFEGKEKSRRLSIGDRVPASVWNSLPKKSTADLVILDFWSTSCSACMEAFPKMKNLQDQFNEKLQIILLNPWETYEKIQDRLTKINGNRIKNKAEPFVIPSSLPTINGDTLYRVLFPARSIPHHVWINVEGKVLAITYGYNATPEHVDAILQNKPLNLIVKDDSPRKELLEKGYLQPTLETLPPVYYSAFIPYYTAGASASSYIDSSKGIFRKCFYNNGVISHFRTAFHNNSRQIERVLVEVQDKQRFVPPKHNYNLKDAYYRNYTFTYEIQGPLQHQSDWQKKMQQDVNYFFGNKFGLTGSMEKRIFRCLILVKIKDGMLKTSGAKKSKEYGNGLKSWINYPFQSIIIAALYELEDMDSARPFLDESGIDPNQRVDLKLVGDLKNIDNLRKQLQQYGLDIIESEREVEVLVIRDLKKEPI